MPITEESPQRVFKEKVNHVTGAREWEVKDDDYDIVQVRRSIIYSLTVFHSGDCSFPFW